MNNSGWEQMTDWWNEKLGDEGDLWHRTLIDPPLLRLVGEVKGLRVLDLACGNGYLSRRFARQGAIVTGVDANEPLIKRDQEREAREPLGIMYHVSDAASLDMLEDGAFDLVICNMALMDIENAAGAIQEVARVLRAGGRFVASISHPCFDKVNTSGWAIERFYPKTTIWRKMSHYREIAAAETPWPVEGQVVYTYAYHRPLSWYFRAFRSSGMVIAALEEPEPTEEFMANSPEDGAWIAEIPLHCVLEAWKLKS